MIDAISALRCREKRRYGGAGVMMDRAKNSVAALWLALAMLAGCRPDGGVAVTALAVGSRLAPDGSIENADTVYRFPRARMRSARTMRALADRVYFAGDTVCFSAEFTRPIARGGARVWFVDPAGGARHAAERIEYDGARVHGFSLVGSLMREFAGTGIGRPLPEGVLRHEVPFAVIVTLPDADPAAERRIDGRILVEIVD
ncbi:MAG TPA: hypothetical protein PLE73_06380 [Spirochaetota bacterium]|nr:hypothetical protein [Spirochaetota bacterium]